MEEKYILHRDISGVSYFLRYFCKNKSDKHIHQI